MRIGIVTSGGDSPGMNAAIEALVRNAPGHATEPLAIYGGLDGLLHGHIEPLSVRKVSGIAAWAGTILGSGRPEGLDREEGLQALIQAARAANLQALVILGGDGSLGYIAARLHAAGFPCVGIPCTIDNDVPGSDYALGFDSACTFALPLVDGMRQTGRALDGRVFVLETLGGKTGHLALAIAHATQADAVAIPEVRPDWALLGQRLSTAVEQSGNGLLIISEGVSWEYNVEEALSAHLQHRIRRSNLGHAQRGGTPSYLDRIIARAMAEAALTAITAGRSGCMVGWLAGAPTEVPLTNVANHQRPVDLALYSQINGSSQHKN